MAKCILVFEDVDGEVKVSGVTDRPPNEVRKAAEQGKLTRAEVALTNSIDFVNSTLLPYMDFYGTGIDLDVSSQSAAFIMALEKMMAKSVLNETEEGREVQAKNLLYALISQTAKRECGHSWMVKTDMENVEFYYGVAVDMLDVMQAAMDRRKLGAG